MESPHEESNVLLIEEIVLPESRSASYKVPFMLMIVKQIVRPKEDAAWTLGRCSSINVPRNRFPEVRLEMRH